VTALKNSLSVVTGLVTVVVFGVFGAGTGSPVQWTSVAVLKGADVDKMRERENVLVVYANVRALVSESAPAAVPVVLDPAKSDTFPKGWVVSDRAAIAWSDDDRRVLFGIKKQVPTPSTARKPSTDEVADVDVWNSSDERIQSVQMIRAEADRNFTFRSALDVAAGKFIKLADETMRDIDVAVTGKWAVGRDTRGYVKDYGRPEADVYRVDTTTGERTLMFKRLTNPNGLGISPTGRHYVFWKDNKINVYDLDTAASRVLGGSATVSWVASPSRRAERTEGRRRSASRSTPFSFPSDAGPASTANSTTWSPPRERMSSAGEPSAITFPWSTTATRSHRRSASSM
jgi:hypothetical protein